MTEMVERVATALFAADGGTDWDSVHAKARAPWIRMAEVAIAAMREPTQVMLKAANDVGIDQGPRDYWPAMIDAALIA